MTTSIQTVKDFAKADLDDVLSKMSQKEMIDLLGVSVHHLDRVLRGLIARDRLPIGGPPRQSLG
jgi:hypothetical protein